MCAIDQQDVEVISDFAENDNWLIISLQGC